MHQYSCKDTEELLADPKGALIRVRALETLRLTQHCRVQCYFHFFIRVLELIYY